MRLLLDTQVLLWIQDDDPRLRRSWLDAIDEAEVAFVSAVSIWEIAIKSSLGKLRARATPSVTARAFGYRPLPITWQHAEAVGALPFHHGDPFDRLLVAQARLEGLTLVTADRMIARYDVPLL